jgi:AAA+ superfamily predicted ATPase
MLEQLRHLVRSGNGLLSVETHDENRAVGFVRKVAEEMQVPLYEWSVTTGLEQTFPAQTGTGVGVAKAHLALSYVLERNFTTGFYVFKDLGPHSKDPFVLRQLRDLAARRQPTVVLVDTDRLPDAARRFTIPLKLELPDAAELEQVVRDTFRKARIESLQEISVKLTKREFEQLVQMLRGLSCSDAARIINLAIHDDLSLTSEDIPGIVEAKRQLLEGSGCLESIAVNVSIDEIGGLAGLKNWLALRREGMGNRAREFGLDPPRGILLLGVQGCGKSLCAKMVAADWKLPLLRMDPGVLYQKFIGESESRLREALDQAEKTSPVVLWIDEIEKAFASAGSESADGGLSQRMFGTLLSWMQDHRSPIFLVATANNISSLPPELMRKGRFDEIFFVDVPGTVSRKQILEVHLGRRKRNPRNFALDDLVTLTEGFSGAELEQLIVAALYNAFGANEELADKHLRDAASSTKPLTVVMREQIASLRAWANGRCVPAD